MGRATKVRAISNSLEIAENIFVSVWDVKIDLSIDGTCFLHKISAYFVMGEITETIQIGGLSKL